MWWCPTGPAAVLPLHAAGRHPRTATQYQAMGEAAALADTVAGRVISSYTSTLTTLARAPACQTAAGDLRLLDEALHLAAALQLTGYRHVLATLWSISDAAAPHIAEAIYAHLLHSDSGHPSPASQPEAARAAYALHHAVTRLRQALPGEPLLWAPYIHLGP